MCPKSVLTDDDSALWRTVMRDVTPLRDRSSAAKPRPPAQKSPPSTKTSTPSPVFIKPPPSAPAPAAPIHAPSSSAQVPGLDKRTAQRFSRGRMTIEGWLDLHGMDQAAAHRTFNSFITSSHGAGKRCVLVVTGKGRGVLRRAVPIWLHQPPLRPLVLSFTPARQKDGGDGALYVLLRRRRGQERGT